MYELGALYEQDPAMAPPDYALAMKWHRRAGEAGHAGAANNIGSFYFNGRGVGQDYREALNWYEKAAARNEPVGTGNVGYIYLQGLGVEKDLVKAMEYFLRAAEYGFAPAQLIVAKAYASGTVYPTDFVKALTWAEIHLAGAQPETDSVQIRGALVARMSVEDQTNAKRLATEWLSSHQEQTNWMKP